MAFLFAVAGGALLFLSQQSQLRCKLQALDAVPEKKLQHPTPLHVSQSKLIKRFVVPGCDILVPEVQCFAS